MDERPDESWPRLRGTDPFRPHPLRDPGRDLPVAGSRGQQPGRQGSFLAMDRQGVEGSIRVYVFFLLFVLHDAIADWPSRIWIARVTHLASRMVGVGHAVAMLRFAQHPWGLELPHNGFSG